jgi:hypothetical protein
MTREPMDDLDRLYARLAPVELPAGFVAEVMAQVRRQQARQRLLAWCWLVVDFLAALVLTWSAFVIGRLLAVGTFDPGAATLLLDPELVLAAPGLWVLAVVELAPVVALLTLVVAAGVMVVATRSLLAGMSRRVGLA